MSTNLLIQLKRETDAVLAGDINNPALSTLTLNLKKVVDWNNSAAVGTNGRVNTGFPINGVIANNAKDFQIKQIEITGATNVLTTFPESTAGVKDRILKLSAADFGGQLTTDKILIDDVNYHTKNDNKTETVVPRDDQKQELLVLERLLETILTKYHNLLDFEHGPDADLIDTTYYFGTDPQVAKDPTNIKHVLFGLKDYYNQKIYELEDLIRGLSAINELIGRGLTKKSHVFLVDNGSGYKESDKPELDKEPGFYKGFPLIDPNLKATPDPTDDNKFKVEKIDPDKPVRFTKKNIDNFRAFATGYTGPNSDIFTKQKTIKDRKGNDIQVFANRKPEECFGFQPGDIWVDNSGDYLYVNGN
ncbi:18008_t:CDS:2 [Cetraspora pellucida]|uniref:18008_t:CDS:1 n=1 Tax=Cetraspora pellucida TaxID=1433469 RepID=A0ACA9MEI8_9GLOM|nr:18008_t:CDS:2 [Cetraspora pellucida]